MKNKFLILFLIIFLALSMLILGIVESPLFQFFKFIAPSIKLELSGKAYEIFKYNQTPCEGKKFTIDKDIILLEFKSKSIPKTLYSITRYFVEDYEKYREIRHLESYYNEDTNTFRYSNKDIYKEIKLYEANSTFEILGYYYNLDRKTFANNSMPVYLIRTRDNHLAWVYGFDFDSNLCRLAKDYFDDEEYHKTIDANYSKEKVKLSEPSKPYSSKDETYAVSKKYYKKLNIKRDREIEEFMHEISQKPQVKHKKEMFPVHKRDINNDIKKGNLSFVHTVRVQEAKKIDKEAMNILKSIDKNANNYSNAKRLLYQINYLKSHPNAEILGANSKIDPITNEVSISIISIDRDTWSDLIKAIANHNRKKIDEILSNNPNLNHSTNNNSKALYFAAKENDTKTLKKLINLGMDINHQNNFGYTPLHVAIISNAFESAEILIKSGANLDIFSHAKSSYRETALKLEAKKKNVNYKILDSLIAHGANINIRYKNEPTILMYASRFCDKDLVDYLLSKGANAKLKNQFGKNSTQIWNENCVK